MSLQVEIALHPSQSNRPSRPLISTNGLTRHFNGKRHHKTLEHRFLCEM